MGVHVLAIAAFGNARRVAARHQCRARGTTNRLGIKVGETNAFRSQAIQVGSANLFRTVAADIFKSLVVREDNNEVRAFGFVRDQLA